MLSYITTYALIFFYYSLFFLSIATGNKSGGGQLKDILSRKGEPGILFTRLIAGIFFLGLCTATISSKRNIASEIFTPAWCEYQMPVWILIAAAIITGTLSASKEIFPAENSNHSLPLYLPLLFILVRTLFLIVYEFFFRGTILFVMIEDLGLITAVIVNLILYALIHWFNKRERYGSVIMGIILCGASIYYHSVWPAILIHLSLALSHEVFLLINNKSLIKKSWS
jgi:membrane protease YdiL (CAAX protease family)